MKTILFKSAAIVGALLTLAACNDDKNEGGGNEPPTSIENIGIRIVETTKNSVKVEYTPSTDQLTYYASIIDKEYFDQTGDAEANIQDDLEYFGLLAKQEGIETSAMIAKLVSKGIQTIPFTTLEPDTQYYAYAFGVNTDGKVTSVLFTETFSTPKPGQSENKLTLTISKIGIDGALITAEATNSDPYILDVWEASKLEGKSDEEIIQAVLGSYDEDELDRITEKGSAPLDLTGRLAAETDYIALAFGYETGVTTTPLVKESFKTRPGDWVDCTFTVRQESLNCRAASFTVTASDDTTPFFFSLIPAQKLTEIGNTDEAIGAYLLEKLQAEADSFSMSLELYLKYSLFRKEKTEDYAVTPESSYYIVAAGINLQGKLITTATRSDKIDSPAVSAATVTFGNPVFGDSEVSVAITPGPGTPKWKAAGMGAASAKAMSDDEMIVHIMNLYTENPEKSSFVYFDDDEEVYFFAVGFDADGNPGQLVKNVVAIPK